MNTRWNQEEFEDLRDHLQDFPKDNSRYTEARYYQGLALYHLGEKKQALALWKETIRSNKQDPWIYRADWAYTNVKQGRRGGWVISGNGEVPSPLGRIGYMGRSNPDLDGPGDT